MDEQYSFSFSFSDFDVCVSRLPDGTVYMEAVEGIDSYAFYSYPRRVSGKIGTGSEYY